MILLIMMLFSNDAHCRPQLTIKGLLVNAERKHNIPKGILDAIARVESNHDYDAFVKHDGSTRKSSFGLMQLQLASARQVGFKGKSKELLTPEVNIEYASLYLKLILKSHKNDVARSLTCYNAGPNSSLCRSKRYSSYVGLVLNALVSLK